MNEFLCRYCGKNKPWEERDYDMGLALAEEAHFHALGHTGTGYASPYLICKNCAGEFAKDGE
jgi:hypothetical protein